jgi:phospholipase C
VSTPIEHLVIACQENRSFDHYFGYAPQVQAAGFGPSAGYFQPDAGGGKHTPFEFTSLTTPDPPHSWPPRDGRADVSDLLDMFSF